MFAGAKGGSGIPKERQKDRVNVCLRGRRAYTKDVAPMGIHHVPKKHNRHPLVMKAELGGVPRSARD